MIVYSANFGNYDTFKEAKVIHDNRIRYIMFSDKPIKSHTWEVIVVDWKEYHQDITKAARYVKTHPHSLLPQHSISVWVDSSFMIHSGNLFNEINSFLGSSDIGCFSHGSANDKRNCLYKEANVCISVKLDSSFVINAQVRKYRAEKYPANNGLFSTGFIIRRNTEKIKEFNELWWSEIKEGSSRDQISQCYSAWKTGVQIKSIHPIKTIYSNGIIHKEKHIGKRKRY